MNFSDPPQEYQTQGQGQWTKRPDNPRGNDTRFQNGRYDNTPEINERPGYVTDEMDRNEVVFA